MYFSPPGHFLGAYYLVVHVKATILRHHEFCIIMWNLTQGWALVCWQVCKSLNSG